MRPPEADKNLKCLFLHYNNHYLRLGPFKYEPLSENPHVGMYREFYTSKEIKVLVEDSKEKLHSTIYYVSTFLLGSFIFIDIGTYILDDVL